MIWCHRILSTNKVMRHDATHFSYMQSEGKLFLYTGMHMDASRCVEMHRVTHLNPFNQTKAVHVIEAIKTLADSQRATAAEVIRSLSSGFIPVMSSSRLFSPNLEEPNQRSSLISSWVWLRCKPRAGAISTTSWFHWKFRLYSLVLQYVQHLLNKL